MKRIVVLIGLGALLLVSAALFWRTTQLQATNKDLLVQVAEAEREASQSRSDRTEAQIQAEIEALHQANKELFKLRNEVSQLRRQKQEAEKLRLENEQLRMTLEKKASSNRE